MKTDRIKTRTVESEIDTPNGRRQVIADLSLCSDRSYGTQYQMKVEGVGGTLYLHRPVDPADLTVGTFNEMLAELQASIAPCKIPGCCNLAFASSKTSRNGVCEEHFIAKLNAELEASLAKRNSYNITNEVYGRACVLGLEAIATGGGCDYISAKLDERHSLLLVDPEDGSPDKLDEPADVILYTDGDQWLEGIAFKFISTQEAMDFMSRVNKLRNYSISSMVAPDKK